MSKALWLRIAVTVLGVVALSLLIWFAGPLLEINDVRPFDNVWVRAVIVTLITVAAAVFTGLAVRKRLKASAELEAAIAEDEEGDSEARVLNDTMQDALATLKRAKGGKGDYLYDLPFYIIIGPPGSGKTTALVNSGLQFPFSRGASPEAVAGVGGTRYCDWWFTEDAVLIDTAGRYTTQDSDPKGDRSNWLTFLNLLKTHRPKQPINGALVAISVEDLLSLDQNEISAHATAIRKRLSELHEQLGIEFPVYALLTKADLVAGFMEYFGHLSETDRRMVWGHTFQTADKTANMIGEVPGEYDALITRLNEQLPDKLQEEPNPASRVVQFGFPSQVAALKRPVVDFLTRIFEPTRYQATATLRGFYFTSGTQQGTPIDQLIGKLARNFGAEQVQAQAYSGRGKSFFLTDLLKKVVIGEAGWVSTNRTAVRRLTIMRAVAFGGVAAVVCIAAGLWWTSYARNSALIAATNTAVQEYRASAAPVIQETTVSDRNFTKVLPLLHKLRNLPTGYGVRDEATPIAATFGLSQRERLQSASETSYTVALERMFRSRLVYRLEEQLEANLNRPAFLYEGLKVYLMLGGRAQLDKELIVAWMRRDWAENLFPGAANQRGREALEEHLVAMLDLDDSGEPLIQLNKALIDDCQRALARLSIAERAYELLKSQAAAQSAKDWTVAKRGGPDVNLIFEGTRGEDLDTIRVPFFYTYEGFHTAFIDRLVDIGDRVESERWVLGAAGEQQLVAQQYATLFPDLLKLYARDFEAAWKQAMARLKIKPLTADKPKYVALAAAGAQTSPIKQLLESVRAETQLTRERPKSAGEQVGQQVADRARQRAQDAARQRVDQMTGGLTTGIQLPRDRTGAVAAGDIPGGNIEALFKHFHVVVEGDLGRRPVDALLQAFSEINQNLAVAATNPQQVPQASQALVQLVANLRATSSRFPAPFDSMIRASADEFEGDASGATIANLRVALANDVTRVCQQIVTNNYPFVRAANREVPLADFSRLFAPGGIMDKFFNTQIAPYVDQSKQQWTWRTDSRVARALSPATLREFQRAADIKTAFFPSGGNLPAFQMVVTPMTLSGDASAARLEINGMAVVSQQGVNAPQSVQWPGGGVGRTTISMSIGSASGGGFFSAPSQPVQSVIFDRQGTWSLYRLLETGSVLRQGEGLMLTMVAGGREVSYHLNVGSLINPLTLPALREFKCPTGI
jgi:type VI secretion system protein ImpL